MIIKQADDKQQQKNVLQALLAHPKADAATKKRIEQEIKNIQAGIKGEQEAAYEMQVHYGDGQNWMVIHDLRIEHGGLVAQIDHLLINRLLEVWVCESKHFSEGIAINEHGEFSAFYGSKPYGVPSPIEQNNRHIVILQRLFDSGKVKLPTRLGFTMKPELKSLVLVSKNARITRPKVAIDGIQAIIKNDMLHKTISKSFDDVGPLGLAKVIGQDTLEVLGKEIVALHRPASIDFAAKFGLTAVPDQFAALTPAATKPAVPMQAQPATVAQPAPAPAPAATEDAAKPKQKLVCHSCTDAIPYNVAKFCWFNKPRFGGNIYCVECQKKVVAP